MIGPKSAQTRVVNLLHPYILFKFIGFYAGKTCRDASRDLLLSSAYILTDEMHTYILFLLHTPIYNFIWLLFILVNY